MPNRKTHFEQIPIEVVEAILQRDAAGKTDGEIAGGSFGEPERQAVEESGKQDESN